MGVEAGEEKRRILERIVEEGRGGVLIQIYVKTGADEDKLVLEGDELVFYTREIPEKGRANAALIRFFTRNIGVPTSKIDIVYGARRHLKRILIRDVNREAFIDKLLEII